MFDRFTEHVDRMVDCTDELDYPNAMISLLVGATVAVAGSIAGMVIVTTRRINKFVDKVLNKDEGE